MKHLKVTSALLSAVMCMSMFMTPVSVMADESAPEETQVEETEKQEPGEEPAETEEQESEAVEDKVPEDEDSAEAADAVLAKGKCGKKLKWTLDKKGTLKITGKGAMYNYSSDPKTGFVNTPWINYLKKIKKIVVSKGVTSIGTMAFFDCAYAKSVSLPKTLKSIGYAAFACTGITKVVIPKKVKTIGTYAFCECEDLVSVSLPKGLTKINDYAFAACFKLKGVSIPATVKTIGEGAFEACWSLTSISIPAGVKTIGESAFNDCIKLVTVKLPVSGVNSIGAKAFFGCKALTKISIPLTVTSIGASAFDGCGELSSVWIGPKQKANLPESAFKDCNKVTFDVHDYAMIGDQFSVGVIAYAVSNPAINGTGTLDVLSVNPDVEKAVIPSVVTYKNVKYKVTKITRYTSQYNNTLKLKTLVIGSNVASIEDDTFAGCPELVSVTGGAGLKTIGSRAFEKCPKLKVFSISSKSLKKIGAYAFSGDTALTTLQFKKTTKLTKAGVKNSLKESSIKTVKVKKKKVKKYKKIFKKKNCGKKVKVKK